jgi:hypothetical protein
MNQTSLAPLSMAELKAYGISTGKTRGFFDSYGHRIEYVRLSPKDWILRSYGSDGIQNTLLTESDHNAFAINTESVEGLQTDQSYNGGLLNPVWLLGSFSPDQNLHAKVFYDFTVGKSKLIVRHMERKQFLMIASHDQIEHLIWHPDSKKIIYSATNSDRYADGIFVWDLETNKEVNVFGNRSDQKHSGPHLSMNQNHWYFAFTGISTDIPHRLLFFAARRTHAPISPKDFFQQSHFHGVEISPTRDFKIWPPSSLGDLYKNPLDHMASLNTNIINASQASYEQKLWMKNQYSGDYYKLLTDWQDLASKANSTALFPYVLWNLALIYSDTFRLLKLKAEATKNREYTNHADIIRSYGLEVATGLLRLKTTPTWLHVTAWNIQQYFATNQILDFNFFDIELPKKMNSLPENH